MIDEFVEISEILYSNSNKSIDYRPFQKILDYTYENESSSFVSTEDDESLSEQLTEPEISAIVTISGDIIPIEMPEHITVLIEDLPTFRAKLGRSRDNLALKISEKIPRPTSVKSELQLLTRGGRIIDNDAELQILEEDL